MKFSLQGLCHRASTKLAMFVINIYIYNQPRKSFAIEDDMDTPTMPIVWSQSFTVQIARIKLTEFDPIDK